MYIYIIFNEVDCIDMVTANEDNKNKTTDATDTNENVSLISVERYILHLIRCSLHGEAPDRLPNDCSWDMVQKLAEFNKVTSSISPAIKSYGYDIPDDVAKHFESAISSTIYRIAMFDMEREAVIDDGVKEGLRFLPLKGILLAGYYPVPGMRWMCDNDILYGRMSDTSADGAVTESLKHIFESHGFTTESVGGVHDVFQKKPFFDFEMHSRLVGEDSDFAAYYSNPWKRAVQVPGKVGEYRFSKEDEYIFMLVHAFKHFDAGGCGIRTLVDEYVFISHNDSMDWDYIEAQLDEIGIKDFTDFAREIKNAAFDVFSDEGVLTDDDWKMISYMFSSGTYGLVSNCIRRSIDKIRDNEHIDGAKARRQYLKERIWLSEKQLKVRAPFFYRHKNLRFILPLYRVVRGALVHPKELLYEWRHVRKYDKE